MKKEGKRRIIENRGDLVQQIQYADVLLKKAARINEGSVPSRRGKTEDKATEIHASEMMTMRNIIENLVGNGEALLIVVVQNAQTLTTKQRPVIHSDFNDKPGQNVQSGCAGYSMNIEEISRCCFEVFHRTPAFSTSTAEGKYDQVAFFQLDLVVPQTQTENVFL